MHSNRSRGTLMSYGDHSAQRRFKSNAPLVMPSRDSAAPSGKRILLATVRDGTVEFRATKEMKRGGRKSFT